ncbi:MAG: hypothetical protein JNM12_10925 [Alphaproteobacteria bacterium]|nr:hypothetical protein [Alphaproteobacteria bacterium]
MTEWSQSEINDVRKGTTESARELAKLNGKVDQSLANDKALLEIFKKVSQQLDTLTDEIRALRNDLAPSLDKPRKLGKPL